MFAIRTFESCYQQRVIDLIVSIQRDEYAVAITAEAQPDLCQIETYYQRGNGNFWLALNADRVIGTVALCDIGNQQVALRKMFVVRDYRGKAHGVSSRLLDTVMGWANQRKLRDIFLGTTAQFVAAHRFYERSGFRLVEKSSLPATFPLMAIDSRFYQLSLAATGQT